MKDESRTDPAEQSAEATLRPGSLGEYIGQVEAKRSLTTLLQAAHRARREGPASRSRLTVTHDDLIDFTPELRAEAIKLVDSQYTIGPLFTPPSMAASALATAPPCSPRAATAGSSTTGRSTS